MSLPAIVQPLNIIGPAIVLWNGYVYYFKDGLKSVYDRESWVEHDDYLGDVAERMKTQKTTFSGRPVGMMSQLTPTSGKSAIFPYKQSQVGASIFGPIGSPIPLVIHTQFGGTANTGQTITFPRGAMTKFAPVKLSSQDSLFGDLEFTGLGVPTAAANVAAAWNTIADSVFADVTYDDTQIISDIYVATFGSAPYAAMGAHNSFDIERPLKLNTITSDDYGITDMTIEAIGPATCKFAPSNLTEAQIWTLLNAQGAAYIQPGMNIAGTTSLVIAGSGNGAHTLVATMTNAGAKNGGFQYDKKNNRVMAVGFTSRITTTTGVPNDNLTFAVT